MKKNKGVVELGVLIVQGMVIAVTAIASTGVFSSNPETLGFNIAVHGLTAYSQMPHVKHDYRVRRAVELCEEGYRGIYTDDCAFEVAEWNDGEVLAYIKDDIEVPQPVMRPRLGG